MAWTPEQKAWARELYRAEAARAAAERELASARLTFETAWAKVEKLDLDPAELLRTRQVDG